MRMWPLITVALLAGCAEPSLLETSDPANGFAPQEGRYEQHSGGLGLVVVLEPCAVGHCINATATNEGTSVLHVYSMCVSPFTDRMSRDGQAVQHREMRAHCLAFGTQEFHPGQMLHWEASWDEQVWDDETAQPAPQGAYEWTVTFRAFHDAGGGSTSEVHVSFPVIVGAT